MQNLCGIPLKIFHYFSLLLRNRNLTIGQFLAGVGNALSLSVPSTMSSNWFPSNLRNVATSIIVVSIFVGSGAAFFLGLRSFHYSHVAHIFSNVFFNLISMPPSWFYLIIHIVNAQALCSCQIFSRVLQRKIQALFSTFLTGIDFLFPTCVFKINDLCFYSSNESIKNYLYSFQCEQ